MTTEDREVTAEDFAHFKDKRSLGSEWSELFNKLESMGFKQDLAMDIAWRVQKVERKRALAEGERVLNQLKFLRHLRERGII